MNSRKRLLLLLVTVVVAGGIGFTAWSMSTATIDVSGSVTGFSDTYGGATQGTCEVSGGVNRSARVVLEAGGETVGLGRSDDGTPSSDRCVVAFTINDVEAGHDFYTLTIGEQPSYELSRTDLDRPVDLVVQD